MTGISVSTASELLSALSSATGGETILLAPGNYGDLTLSNLNYDSTVTIRSASDDERATFGTLFVSGSSNITFDSVDVNFTPDEETVAWSSAVRITESSDIAFVDLIAIGGPAVNGVPPETEAGGLDSTGNVLGLPAGKGIMVFRSNDITIKDSDISQFHNGISAVDTDGLNVINNEIHDLRASPLNGGGNDNVLVDGNHFHDFFPWRFGGAGDHGDLVHFWTRDTQDGPSVNYTITNNFFEQGAGTALLGIYLDDDLHGIGYENVTIAHNVIYNGNPQGIRLENVNGGVIESNTLLNSQIDDASAGPSIILRDGNSNLQINSNIVSNPLSLETGSGTSTTVTTLNNLVVQSADPVGSNYTGDLFVNPLVGADAQITDLQALPGGIVEQMGVGAPLTAYASMPGDATGIILDVRNTGLDLLRHSFVVTQLNGPGGPLDLAGATVSWDFGDGTQSSNVVSDHVYPDGGTYDVAATIELADGQVITVAKTIRVESPIALLANFDSGGEDLSYVANPFSLGPLATLEANEDGQALRLNGGAATFTRSPELFGNPEFTVLIDFKKDSANLTGGRLITFNGTLSLDVGDQTVQAQIHTDKGIFTLRASNLAIDDDHWHTLAVTFSGGDGTAKLYVDGVEASTTTGATGAIQTGNVTQHFYLGDPWGSTGFPGLIDNLAFLRGALNADQVAQGFSELDAILGTGGSISSSVGDDLANVITGNNQHNTHDTGQAIRLDGGLASYASPPEFFNNSEYTILVDFKKDAAGDGGRVVNLSGSLVINIDALGLAVGVATSAGSVWLHPTNFDVADTDWHSLAVTFSGSEGTAILYLDGTEVARATGLQGAVQVGGANQPFVLGDPWKPTGFSGLVDNVAFLRGVLSADQIAQGYSELDTIVTGATNTTSPSVGEDLANVITGNNQHNEQFAIGGNDTYVGSTIDTAVEVAGAVGGPADHVSFTGLANQTYGLADNVELLTLMGNATSRGTGNILATGNAASNVLNGWEGEDRLTGGAGNDFFVFDTAPDAASNMDIITDFNVAADTFRLDNAVLTKLGANGALSAAEFWKSATGLAHDANDRVIYETDTGKLFYDSNGNAAGGRVQLAVLTSHPAITHADFFII